MSKFIGVKTVEAVPMTALEASKKHYRVGQDEAIVPPTTEGYEVTYEDGYKSWCPAKVFEKKNIKIVEENITDIVSIPDNQENYVKKLGIEHNELVSKYKRLVAFTNTSTFNNLREDRKQRLLIQSDIMKAYIAILQERINDAIVER